MLECLWWCALCSIAPVHTRQHLIAGGTARMCGASCQPPAWLSLGTGRDHTLFGTATVLAQQPPKRLLPLLSSECGVNCRVPVIEVFAAGHLQLDSGWSSQARLAASWHCRKPFAMHRKGVHLK